VFNDAVSKAESTKLRVGSSRMLTEYYLRRTV